MDIKFSINLNKGYCTGTRNGVFKVIEHLLPLNFYHFQQLCQDFRKVTNVDRSSYTVFDEKRSFYESRLNINKCRRKKPNYIITKEGTFRECSQKFPEILGFLGTALERWHERDVIVNPNLVGDG